MSSSRRPIYFNARAANSSCPARNNQGLKAFHQSLANYSPSPLVALPDLATDLGVRGVYVKDESSRFGLPSFKILGASWGTFRAISKYLSLPAEIGLDELSAAAMKVPIKLFAATDGNHGRAVAFMAKLLSLQADIFVPEILDDYTCGLISGEGASLHVVSGDYDKTVQRAAEIANATHGGLLVQDTSFPGYEEIPSWIVDGYSTMLYEIDQQLANLGLHSTIMITPVGVGSLAHAVARYCKSGERAVSVVTVEPDTAACLHQSLNAGSPVSIATSHTIMSGMNCGTVSLSAWDDMQKLVDASTTISCFESHCAVQYLSQCGVAAGPCGAASLAALRLLASAKVNPLKLDQDSVIVLLSTEGARPYQTPLDVSHNDPVAVGEVLAAIRSAKPTSTKVYDTEKTEIANYIMAWLDHRGIENRLLETVPGSPSAVMAVDGSGRDISLTLPDLCDVGRHDTYDRLANAMTSLITARLV